MTLRMSDPGPDKADVYIPDANFSSIVGAQ